MKDWETTVEVPRGQLVPVEARLRPSVGRGGAYVTAVLGGLFVIAGTVLGVVSNDMLGQLEAERDAGALSSNDSRILLGQGLAIGADVAFGLGLIFGGLSIFYFLQDPLPDSEGRVREPRDWTLAPAVGPGLAGGSFGWRF
jgi:hypothetical protein